jgi:transcriptional regulator with XRE-family HTH domain
MEDGSIDPRFGEALRAHRRAAGLSQRELAQRAGLDFTYISKVENNRLPPPAADTVVTICRVLGLPQEELLALTGKLPSGVQAHVSTSKEGQRFLLDAERLSLTEDEWARLVKSLHQLRDTEEPDR